MELDEVLDNLPVCKQIVFRLCKHGEIYLELVRAMALQNQIETHRTTNTQLIIDCIGFLKRANYIIIENILDEDLQKCVEEVERKGDKRIKDPVKYCLKKKKGVALNVVKPNPNLCFLLKKYYASLGYVVKYPLDPEK